MLFFILGETNKKLDKGVDCWLNKPRKKLAIVGSKEKEIVLDPKPPPLSLGNVHV